jgi:O-antigen/teichoic acid export membrane protein
LSINKTKTSLWNIFFQYSTFILNLISGILLVPLYLKFIDIKEYGIWLATGNILAWIAMFDPGFGTLLQQKVGHYYGQKNTKVVGKYIFVGFFINLIIVSLIIFGIFLLKNSIFKLLGLSANYSSINFAITLSIIATFLNLISFIPSAINQAMLASVPNGLITVITNVLGISLTVFLLYNSYGILSLGVSILFRAILAFSGNFIYLFIRVRKESIKLSYDSEIRKEFLSLSVYPFVGKLSNTLTNQFSSFAIATIISPVTVTLYKFSTILPETCKMIFDRPTLSILPALVNLNSVEENKQKVKLIILRYIKFLIWGSGLYFIGFFIFNKYIINFWVGKSFIIDNKINFLIVLYFYISIFTQSFNYLIFSLGDFKKSQIILFIQSIFYLTLLFFLTKYFQLFGVILASLLSEMFFSLLYSTKSLINIINFTKNEIKILINEFIKIIFLILLILIILSVIIFFINIKYLSTTVFFILFTIIFYTISLKIVSKEFDLELKNFANLIKNYYHDAK